MTKHSRHRRPIWYFVMLQFAEPTAWTWLLLSLPLQLGIDMFLYMHYGWGWRSLLLAWAVFMLCVLLAGEREQYLHEKATQREEESE
jgi:hypothetical protein